MVLLFMQFKAVFLPIQQRPPQSTDKTKRVLIFLQFLFILSEGSKLVDDDSPDDLLNDDFNDEQVDEVYEHVLQGLCREEFQNCCGVVVVAGYACVHSET